MGHVFVSILPYSCSAKRGTLRLLALPGVQCSVIKSLVASPLSSPCKRGGTLLLIPLPQIKTTTNKVIPSLLTVNVALLYIHMLESWAYEHTD